jgi:uncharacterized SAM-binding protein YcdF (DUF218 family)
MVKRGQSTPTAVSSVSHRPETLWARAGAAGLVAGLLLLVQYRLWLPEIGRYLIVADPLQKADVIVPLAGERSRVFYAADLYRDGLAPWFAITEMRVGNPNPEISYVQSVTGQTLDAGVPHARIAYAPGQAATTYEEAWNLRQMALARGWHSLIVVTSPFHTRRARLILHEVFRDTGISIIIRPVPAHWYDPANWWTTAAGRQITLEEYLKLAAHAVGYERFAGHLIKDYP